MQYLFATIRPDQYGPGIPSCAGDSKFSPSSEDLEAFLPSPGIRGIYLPIYTYVSRCIRTIQGVSNVLPYTTLESPLDPIGSLCSTTRCVGRTSGVFRFKSSDSRCSQKLPIASCIVCLDRRPCRLTLALVTELVVRCSKYAQLGPII